MHLLFRIEVKNGDRAARASNGDLAVVRVEGHGPANEVLMRAPPDKALPLPIPHRQSLRRQSQQVASGAENAGAGAAPITQPYERAPLADRMDGDVAAQITLCVVPQLGVKIRVGKR